MALTEAKCTNCGANIKVDPAREAANCDYCGAAFIVEKAINNYNIANAQILAENVTVNISGESPTVTSLMKRAHLALEDEKWEQADGYFNKILDIAPEHAPAYIGKLLSELKACKEDDLAKLSEKLSDYANFKKGLRFADENYKSMLLKYQKESYINLLQRNYINAVQDKETARRKVKNRRIATVIFASICVICFIRLNIGSKNIESNINDLLERYYIQTPYDLSSFREKLDICLKSGTSYWYGLGEKDKSVKETEKLISEMWSNRTMDRYENLKKSLFWHKFWFNAFGYISLAATIISGFAFLFGKDTYKDMGKTENQIKNELKEMGITDI